MKLVAEQGLWTAGPPVAAPPAVAVLEVAGAVLAWTVDEPAGPAQLTFTEVTEADWLWRVTGEQGHVAVVTALQGVAADPGAVIEVAELEPTPAALAPLRRIALGHWLRRWWPASVRDGIVELDIALLDAELAVLTAAAQDFFTEGTLDSDITGLLRPHRKPLATHLRSGDPRVIELVESCAELADWPDVAEPLSADRHRDDYALAAGAVNASRTGVIASGSASISWGAVPPRVFDAAEDTVDWFISADGNGGAVASVRTVLSAPAGGIAVRLRCGDVAADSSLDENGAATMSLAMREAAAWNHDWDPTVVSVGAGDVAETPEVRDRIRMFARSRLAVAADDAFLAEVLAAESDY